MSGVQMSPRNARNLPGAGDVGARAARAEAGDANVQSGRPTAGVHLDAARHRHVGQGNFASSPGRDEAQPLLLRPQVHRYFEALPEDKVPRIDSPGDRYRDKQIAYQLPKQDLALSYCKHIEPENHASYEDFVSGRNEIALDIGHVKDAPATVSCTACDGKIQQGELAVIAPKFRDQVRITISASNLPLNNWKMSVTRRC